MKEDKEENLTGKDALAKIREIADEVKTCFFCTDIRTGIPLSVRPMAILQVDDSGSLWFMSPKKTKKEDEIEENPFVHLMMQSVHRSGFLNLYGIADELHDQEKINELWNPSMDVWFDGPEDPEILLIRVEVLEGHYWDNKHSAPVAAFKGLKSLITGKPDHDGVHGEIDI